MKNILMAYWTIWFLLASSNFVAGQKNTITEQYPDWFLEKVLHSNQCIHSPKLGISIFWKDDSTHDFLLRMLKDGDEWQQAQAITYLGMSKKTEYVPILSPFLNGKENHILPSSAIGGLVSIGTKESAIAIGEYLSGISNHENDYNQIKIIEGLKQISHKEGKKYLLEFIKKSDSKYLINKAEEAILVINRFNENEVERKNLIVEMLNSDENDDIRWALSKIRIAENVDYLEEVRNFSLKNDKYMEATLSLRKSLGETSFSRSELEILEDMERQKKKSEQNSQKILLEGRVTHEWRIDDF